MISDQKKLARQMAADLERVTEGLSPLQKALTIAEAVREVYGDATIKIDGETFIVRNCGNE